MGPTHNYGGLSVGNIASMAHEGNVANPRLAALEGLQKMRFVHANGVGQAVLPPHDRPSLRTLRRLGFTGSDEDVLVPPPRIQSRSCVKSRALRRCGPPTPRP